MGKYKNKISDTRFGEERALYATQSALITGCSFSGPEDGESALKESRDFAVEKSFFSLRYPFWHCKSFSVTDCTLDEGVRAAAWYSKDGEFAKCRVNGVKFLRESSDITLTDCKISSDEFGWRCSDVTIKATEINSQYFLFESNDVTIGNLTLNGKYSFQYVRSAKICDSVLNTKDAFWHSKNVTVKNCEINGEYLGWYSENLTLENCVIRGTQPLCYCKNLRLINCTTEGCDLAFEYSDVEADIIGYIESVKNPKSGSIRAGKIGSTVMKNSVVKTTCKITETGIMNKG